MFKCLFIILYLVFPSDCRTNYIMSMPHNRTMSNKLLVCNNWGEDKKTTAFDLPHLDTIGLMYMDIDDWTRVTGNLKRLKINTEAAELTNVTHLLLDRFDTKDGFKEFSKNYGLVSRCSYMKTCRQNAFVELKVRFFEDGGVRLKIILRVGSWAADSCAAVKVSVASLTISNWNMQ